MSIIGNIIWFIFGGFVGLFYMLGGALLCLTIVGIPFGMQSIQVGLATITPFGKEVKQQKQATGFLSLLFDLIWIVLFGWELAIGHVVAGLILMATVIGIPFGIQHFKLIPVALFPFNYTLE